MLLEWQLYGSKMFIKPFVVYSYRLCDHFSFSNFSMTEFGSTIQYIRKCACNYLFIRFHCIFFPVVSCVRISPNDIINGWRILLYVYSLTISMGDCVACVYVCDTVGKSCGRQEKLNNVNFIVFSCVSVFLWVFFLWLGTDYE